MQRCREIEAEISRLRQTDRWQDLAAREKERLAEEQRQLEEERRIAAAREKYRELSEEKAEAVAGVGCLSNGLEKRRSRWCTG